MILSCRAKTTLINLFVLSTHAQTSSTIVVRSAQKSTQQLSSFQKEVRYECINRRCLEERLLVGILQLMI